MNKKHLYNFEYLTVIGNIGSDIKTKTKNKERLEFSVAVNKTNLTKWFNIVVFNPEIISQIKQDKNFTKGANIRVHGEVSAELYNDKPYLKILAHTVSLNSETFKESA